MRIITPAVQPLVSAALVMRQTNLVAEGGEADPIDVDLLTLYAAAAVEWAEDFLGFILAPTLVELVLPAFPADGGAIVLDTETALSIDSILYTAADGTDAMVEPTFALLDPRSTTALISLAPTRAWPTAQQVSPIDTTVRVRTVVGFTPADAEQQLRPLPKRVTAAVLMVAAHLYRNRESTTAESLQTLPQGAEWLIHPLKRSFGFA